jgi:sulfatase modifying factor 1
MNKECPVCKSQSSYKARFCWYCGLRFSATTETYDAFISYRRDGASELAALLQGQLEARFKKHVFLDVDGLKSGRFDEHLLDIISRTPNFILVLGGHALARCTDENDWLRREIVHAFESQRNIVPVLVEGFTFPDPRQMEMLPAAIRQLDQLQRVEYHHVHRDAAIGRIAGYFVRSIATEPPAEQSLTRRSRPTRVQNPTVATEKPSVHTVSGVAEQVRACMVSIPPGEFLMGNEQTDRVMMEIRSPLLMDKYQITEQVYAEVMSDHPAQVVDSERHRPMTNVSWVDAVTFCNKLSLLSSLEPVYNTGSKDVTANFKKDGFRLPTEAEWEYACLGGCNDKERHGPIEEVARYNRNTDGRPSAVGGLSPNGFGLYDMLGNVWEWCNDRFTQKHPTDRQVDYGGPLTGGERVVRGGSWIDRASEITARSRSRWDPVVRKSTVGFRVARRPGK